MASLLLVLACATQSITGAAYPLAALIRAALPQDELVILLALLILAVLLSCFKLKLTVLKLVLPGALFRGVTLICGWSVIGILLVVLSVVLLILVELQNLDGTYTSNNFFCGPSIHHRFLVSALKVSLVAVLAAPISITIQLGVTLAICGCWLLARIRCPYWKSYCQRAELLTAVLCLSIGLYGFLSSLIGGIVLFRPYPSLITIACCCAGLLLTFFLYQRIGQGDIVTEQTLKSGLASNLHLFQHDGHIPQELHLFSRKLIKHCKE